MPSGGKCTAMIETEMWLQTQLGMPLPEVQPRYDNTDNHKIVKTFSAR